MEGNNNNVTDSGGFGWGLLGFCIPIVGLALFPIWKGEKPKTARAADMGVSMPVIVGVVFYTLVFVVMGIGAATVY